jgi:hypothetical protein
VIDLPTYAARGFLSRWYHFGPAEISQVLPFAVMENVGRPFSSVAWTSVPRTVTSTFGPFGFFSGFVCPGGSDGWAAVVMTGTPTATAIAAEVSTSRRRRRRSFMA